jgi:hypothetical protein
MLRAYGTFGFDAAQMAALHTHYQWVVIGQGTHVSAKYMLPVQIFFGNNIKKAHYNVDSNELCNKIQVVFDVTLCCWENNSRRFERSYVFHY